jgi:hypothetical protein
MAGKWDIGFLDLQTHKFNSDRDPSNTLSSENFGVLRMRRNIMNQNSYVGGIVTSRMGVDGKYNIGYGADAILKVVGNDYLNFKVAQVMADSAANKIASLQSTQVYVGWKRFTNKGFGYNVVYSRSGKDYNPGMGFQMRKDYSFYNGSMSYGWMRGEKSPFINDNLEFAVTDYHMNATNTVQSRMFALNYNFFLKSGGGMFISFSHQFENVTDTFSFSDRAFVPSGNYNFNLLEIHAMTTESRPLFFQFDLWAGSYFDGNRLSVSVSPKWNASSFLQLGLTYGIDWLKFSSRRQTFTGQLTKINAQLMFSTKFSFSSYIQYNSAENNIITNMRLRYNPSEGNDLFLVINEGRNTYLDRELPTLPRIGNRTMMIKYTYTFSL